MGPASTDEVAISSPRPRILHLTKVPPSDSGVAHFAAPFTAALGLLGHVTTMGLPGSARDSQRTRIITRTAWATVQTVRLTRPDLLVVQLSGRGLAEMYAALAVVHLRRRPTVWLVAHDAPSLVGAALLTHGLDRRGGRRIGMAASDHIGRRLEQRLVARVDVVLSFSEPGAEAVADRYPGVTARSVPLPVTVPPPEPKERVVYVPSHVEAADVMPVLDAVASSADHYRLRVGNLPIGAAATIRAQAERCDMAHRLELTGYLDDEELDRSFATAALVVRHRRPGVGGNELAVSGPIVSALAAGCAVISTDPRGSAPCLADGVGIDLSARPERLVPELTELLSRPDEVARLGRAAQRHVVEHHRPEVVARRLATLWPPSPGPAEPRPGSGTDEHGTTTRTQQARHRPKPGPPDDLAPSAARPAGGARRQPLRRAARPARRPGGPRRTGHDVASGPPRRAGPAPDHDLLRASMAPRVPVVGPRRGQIPGPRRALLRGDRRAHPVGRPRRALRITRRAWPPRWPGDWPRRATACRRRPAPR